MSRIVTVHSPRLLSTATVEMGFIRWHSMSAALARLGHSVDIASAELRYRWRLRAPSPEPGLRIVPISRVRWEDYDAVKLMFHSGFETLRHYGGDRHPFIIAGLGTVVGPRDLDGIYFYGSQREQLYRVQQEISEAARYVSVICEPALELWREFFGNKNDVLLVPGAADSMIPPPGRNPYPQDGRVVCVFSGSFYTAKKGSQLEAHQMMAGKLNSLGRALHARGARLYVVGLGDHKSLDPTFVTWCGAVDYDASWDYMYFAQVGVALCEGTFRHNNETTKTYSYLRVGLPVVSESGFPNDNVVHESGLGFVVRNGDPEHMADKVVEAAHARWDREAAVRYILDNHTWDQRALVYNAILPR